MKSTRTHIYFCMKNSSGNEDDFRETLLTVVDHYQVKQSIFKFKTMHFIGAVHSGKFSLVKKRYIVVFFYRITIINVMKGQGANQRVTS